MADEKELETVTETDPVETVPVENVSEGNVSEKDVSASLEDSGTPEPSEKETATAKDKILTALGIVICVILAPILIANCTMIIKSYTNADQVPSFGGYCPFIVLTDSMFPTIKSGDLVIDKVVTDAGDIRQGDVISFFDPASSGQTVVTHRVAAIVSDSDGVAFRTKGDGNNTEDKDIVPAKNVVGVYRTKIDGVGNVVMFMQSTPGLIVCVALPIVLLVGYDLLRRKKYEKERAADTAALMKELEELRAMQKK